MKSFLVFLGLCFSVFYFSLNPQWYFEKSYSGDYADIFEPKKSGYDFEKISSQIKFSAEKADFLNKKAAVFLTDSPLQFFFFAYGRKNVKYWVNPLNGKVIMAPCVLENDKLKLLNFSSAAADYEIIKAALAAMVRLSVEPFEFIMAKKWKIEGFAAYNSMEMPMYTPKDLCSPRNESEYVEFENMMCVKYMSEFMKLKKEELIFGKDLKESILKDARIYLCK